jgi:hypothetical protein
LPRPASVTIIFGDAIHPDELSRRGMGKEPAERITNALRDAVADLGRRETRRRAA